MGPTFALLLTLTPTSAGSAATAPGGDRSDTDVVQSGGDVFAREPASPDSTSLFRDARSAQARFERTRVNHLPWTWRGMGGECDERIGRMCLRHSRSDDWDPPPEEPAVGAARDELLETLERIGREIPGDDWVLGQRVRYLGEAGRWDEAGRLGEACEGATPWWCEALRGFALHGSGEFVEAERAFLRALSMMPEDRLEDWADPSVLLDRDGRGFVGGEEGREARRQRIWALGNPLYLVAGNDRKTEHFARHVLAEIHEGARNPYGMSWGGDLAEILVRYGAEAGFERQRQPPGRMGPPSVMGRFQPGSRGILPPGRYLEDPGAIPFREWELDDRRARARYAPPYSPRIRMLEGQQAVFRRGDSVLVVLAYRVPPGEDPDAAPGEGPMDHGLFLVQPSGEVEAHVVERSGEVGVLSVRAPNGTYVVSGEVWDREERKAWRVRHGVRQENLPRGLAGVSGLLAIEAREPVPESLEEALPHALPAPEVTVGGAVGIAWEVYNLSPGDGPLEFRLRIREESPGFLRRIGQWLRLVSPERPTEVSWEEGEEDTGVLFRAVNVDLAGLSAGTYEVELSLQLPGRETARVTRSLRVVEPPSG